MKLIPCSAFLAPGLGERNGDRGCRREFLRVSSLRAFISLISHLQRADDVGLFFGRRDLVQDAPCRGRAAGKRDVDRGRVDDPGVGFRRLRFLAAARSGPGRSWRRLFFRERAPRQALERIDMRINDRVSDPFNRPQLPPEARGRRAVRQRSRILIETKIEIFRQLHLARARPLDHVGRDLPQLRLKFVRQERRLWKHPRLQLVLQREQQNRGSYLSAPLSCGDFPRLGTACFAAAGSVR